MLQEKRLGAYLSRFLTGLVLRVVIRNHRIFD